MEWPSRIRFSAVIVLWSALSARTGINPIRTSAILYNFGRTRLTLPCRRSFDSEGEEGTCCRGIGFRISGPAVPAKGTIWGRRGGNHLVARMGMRERAKARVAQANVFATRRTQAVKAVQREGGRVGGVDGGCRVLPNHGRGGGELRGIGAVFSRLLRPNNDLQRVKSAQGEQLRIHSKTLGTDCPHSTALSSRQSGS